MTTELELWSPGWEVEPREPAPPPDPDEQAFTDLHGPQPEKPREITDVPTGDLL